VAELVFEETLPVEAGMKVAQVLLTFCELA
jgi:hypothetical protein